MSSAKKKGQDGATLAYVSLDGLSDVQRLEAAAVSLLDALGQANTPGVSRAAQEGVALRAVMAFAQDALPDLARTSLLDGLRDLANRKLQGQVAAHTRTDGRPPVSASEGDLRCHAVACVRFLVQHGQMSKTKARQTVADVLRKTGCHVAPSAVKNWETKWLPEQEIGPDYGAVLPEASPSRAVQTIQDALGANYSRAIDDPVRMVARVLKRPAARR